MTPNCPGEEGGFGMPLDEYLSSKAFDLSRRASPSKEDILQAIHSLTDHKNVSCATFETILAMGRASAGAHLGLLLSDIGVLPACVKLLRVYCHVKGRGLLDDAYGFLCLQVIALTFQVAVLSQTNQLKPFLSIISKLPPTQSISPNLHSHVRQVERQAMFGPRRRGTEWLFGWYHDETTGQLVCLPHVGGCTIVAAKFLVERMWLARAEFLRAAEWTSMIFPGWGSFLHTIRNAIVRSSGGVESTSFRGTSSDHYQCWIHFADISYRYTLCSGEILQNRGMGSSLEPHVDVLDSKQISAAFLKKARRRPRPHVTAISMLFAYTCRNFDLSNFEDSVTQMFQAMIELLWGEVSKAHHEGLNSEQWTDLGNGIGTALSMLVYMLQGYPAKAPFLLNVATGEDLLEFLGCLIVAFASLSETSQPAPDFPISKAQSVLWNDVGEFGSALKNYSSTRHFEPDALVFPAWPSILKMTESWSKAWLKIGATVGLEKMSRHALECAYPRCAAPNVPFIWECSGCKERRYCSRRCQQADWVYPQDSHASNCGRSL